MLTMAIWGIGALLEVLVLVRGYQEKLFRNFPIFYAYLLFVTLVEFVRFAVYRWSSGHYSQVFWVTQFVSLAIGSAVIFEIYRKALRDFPGAARMARWVLLTVFGVIFARALVNTSDSGFAWLAQTSLLLERNLRIVQALAIAALVCLFLWYAIPFGRNLKGILTGYGLFVGMSVLEFVLLNLIRGPMKSIWTNTEGVAFLIVLAIWTRTLWTSQPVPQCDPRVSLERDYELLVVSTRDQFRRTLTRLGWAARG